MSKRIEKELNQAKVVIRHLPCKLTKEIFLQIVNPLPENDYFCFVEGDKSFEQVGFARAYIGFVNQDDIFPFKERYDGYLFEDSYGNKSNVIVEYAPFQRIPKRSKRKAPDPKCGTLESDPDYVSFLTELEKEVEPLPSVEKTTYLLEDHQLSNTKTVTPLIEYLKEKKDRKEKQKAAKEARRKQKKFESRDKKKTRARDDSPPTVRVIPKSSTSRSDPPKSGHANAAATGKVSSSTKTHQQQSAAQSSPVPPPDRSVSTPQGKANKFEEASVHIISRPGTGSRRTSQQGGGREPQRGQEMASQPPSRSISAPQGSVRTDRRGKEGSREKGRPSQALYVPKNRTDDSVSETRSNDRSYSGSRGGRGRGSGYRGGHRYKDKYN